MIFLYKFKTTNQAKENKYAEPPFMVFPQYSTCIHVFVKFRLGFVNNTYLAKRHCYLWLQSLCYLPVLCQRCL